MVREWCPLPGSRRAGRVGDQLGKRTEIARPLGSRRNRLKRGRGRRVIAVSIVVAEEEHLVLLDGAADGGAEFVLMFDRRGRREEASCIENRIAEVLGNASAKRIPARFQNV